MFSSFKCVQIRKKSKCFVILHHIGAKVYTIERQKLLFDKTSRFLAQIGFGRIRTLYGDGFIGAPRFAPYDKILITAAAPFFPEDLFNQLKPNGYMVIPIGEGEVQRMKRITKLSDGTPKEELFGNFSFVPMLAGINAS